MTKRQNSRYVLKQLTYIALASTCLTGIPLAKASAQMNAADGNTQVYQAPNGVTVVDIATANSKGLSHNKFTDYNVGREGVVLNNANADTIIRQSQLAGQVLANQNLRNEATTILNEVVSTNRSELNGFTEVLGGKANVIIANPNGISCDGCGFINTPRATLTTGRPQIDDKGAVSHYEVRGGTVTITGKGINAEENDYLALVARKVEIDGQINANELDIIAGTNDWNSDTQTATPVKGDKDSPDYAIDGSALGGMYAGKIRLIATEEGVGVRMRSDMASSVADIQISAAGKIEMIDNAVTSEQDITVTTTAQSDKALQAINTKIEAKRDIILTGQKTEVELQGGTFIADNNLTISAADFNDIATASTDTDNNQRIGKEKTEVNVTGTASLNNTGYRTKIFKSTNDVFEMNGVAAFIRTDLETNLKSEHKIDLTDGLILSEEDIALNAANLINIGKDFQGLQSNNANIKLDTKELQNASTIAALTGAVLFTVTDKLTNTGSILSTKDLIFGSSNLDIDNQGIITAKNKANITSNVFENSGNFTAVTSTDVNTAEFNNSGTLIASITNLTNSTITAQNFKQTGTGHLETLGALTLNASTYLDMDGTYLVEDDLTIQAGNTALMKGKGEISGNTNITAKSLTNEGLYLTGLTAGGLDINATENFTNKGNLQSRGDATFAIGKDFSNESQIISLSSINMNGGDSYTFLANSLTQADKDITLNAQQAALSLDGNMLADNIALTAASLTNRAFVQADKTLNATMTNLLTNEDTLYALGQAFLTADTLNNKGTLQSDEGVQTLSVNNFINSGNVFLFGANHNATNLTFNNFENASSGFIELAKDISFNIKKAFTNNGIITTTDNITLSGDINAPQAVTITTGKDSALVSNKTLKIQNASITNTGELSALDIDFDNVNLTNNNLVKGYKTVKSQNSDIANNGTIIGGNVNLAGGTLTNNSGAFISSPGSVETNFGTTTNDGTILAKDAIIKGTNITHNGIIAASAAAFIIGTQSVTQNGLIDAVSKVILQTANDISFSTTSVTNADSGNIELNSSKSINTQGTFIAGHDIVVNTPASVAIFGSSTKMQTGNDLTVNANEMRMYGTNINIANNLVFGGTGAILAATKLVVNKDLKLTNADMRSLVFGTSLNIGDDKAYINGNLDLSALKTKFELVDTGSYAYIFGDLTVGSDTNKGLNFKNGGHLYVSGKTTVVNNGDYTQKSGSTLTSIGDLSISNTGNFISEANSLITTNGTFKAWFKDLADIKGSLRAVMDIGMRATNPKDQTPGVFKTYDSTSMRAGRDIVLVGPEAGHGAGFESERADATMQGNIIAGRALTLEGAGDIKLAGTLASGGKNTLNLGTNALNILNGGRAQFGADSVITAENINVAQGGVFAMQNGIVNAGTLINDGNIYLSTDKQNATTIYVNELTNNAQGSIQALDNANFYVGTIFKNYGDIFGSDNLAFTDRFASPYEIFNFADGIIQAEGKISAQNFKNLKTLGYMEAKSFDVDGETFLNDGVFYIDAPVGTTQHRHSDFTLTKEFGQYETFYAPHAQVTITAPLFKNYETLDVGRRGVIKADELQNYGVINLDSNTGTDIVYAQLNADDSLIESKLIKNAANAVIQSPKSLKIDVLGQLINDGRIIAQDDIDIVTSNKGGALNIANGSTTNATAEISAGNNLTFTDIYAHQNYGLLSAGHDFTMRTVGAGETYTNNGIIAGGNGDFLLASDGSLNNADGGRIILSRFAGGNGVIDVNEKLENHGSIATATNATLLIGNALENKGDIEADGDLSIRGKFEGQTLSVKNNGYEPENKSKIASYGGTLSITGFWHTVDNWFERVDMKNLWNNTTTYGRDMFLAVNEFELYENQGLRAGRNLTLNAKKLLLQVDSSYLVAGTNETGKLSIIAEVGGNDGFINQGLIHSNGDLDLSFYGFKNRSTGGISATNDMVISAGGYFLNKGSVYAGRDLRIDNEIGIVLIDGTTKEPVKVNTHTDNYGNIDVERDLTHTLAKFINNIPVDVRGQYNADPKLTVGRNATFTGVEGLYSSFENNNFSQVVVGETLKIMDMNDILNRNSFIGARHIIAETERSGATFKNIAVNDYADEYINFLGIISLPTGDQVQLTDYTSTISASSISVSGFSIENTGGAQETASYIDPTLTELPVDDELTAAQTGSSDANKDSSQVSSNSFNDGKNADQSDDNSVGTAVSANQEQNGESGDNIDKPEDIDPKPLTQIPSHNKDETKAQKIAEQQGQEGGALQSVKENGETTGLNFSGLIVNLPTSPNGRFVRSKDPQSNFLIETNPLFTTNVATVGSNYLFERLNYDPDKLGRRLGDASFETQLVREQLINQVGTNLLNRNLTEAQQMTGLMNNATKVAQNMNLEIGKPLTETQIASLDEDMIWMVETEVDGEKVLAPVVYLASATRELFDAGNANILADDIDLNGTQFANSGNIQGSNTLSIRTKGDITNVGGSISGGDVLLASTDGDVNNIRTTRDRTIFGSDRTLLNDMASMQALNSLTVAAGGDVNNIGGNMSVTASNGDGLRIQAGNNINFGTVTTGHSFTGSNDRASNSTTHHVSNVYSASDIMMYAGNDANFTALNMNALGNMGIGAGNDVNLLNVYNESYSRSEKKTKSCYMCNGSIKSKTTTQTESYSRESVGNNFSSGGNMNLNAGNNILSIGSQLNSGGNMNLSAGNDVDLYSAQNINTTTTNTTVERAGAFTSSSEAKASGASASSGGEGRFAINETTNLVDTNTKIRNTGNGLNSGGNLVLDAGNDITIIGGDLKAKETVGMRGNNITNMASEDADITTSTMKQNSTGLYISGQAGASGASNVGGNSGADASVEAGVYTNQTNSSRVSGSTIANTTNIEGKNVVREARGTMTDEGTNITAEENISNTAKDARFMAAENTTFDSSQTTTHEGKIGAFAEVGGNTGGIDAAGQGEDGGASGSGALTKTDGGAGKGVKASYEYSNQQSENQTSTAVTGSMSAGGSINNKTDGSMVFEGTAMQAGDAINVDATSVTFDAARNTSQSSENSENIGVEVKASKKDVSASGEVGFSRKNENSDDAVTGSMTSGSGGINITTKGDQNYEGTDMQTEGDLNRISTSGGDINDNEAKNTSSKSEITVNVGGDTDGNVSVDGTYIDK